MKNSTIFSAAILAAGLSINVQSAYAGSKMLDYIDANSTRLRGAIETNSAGNVDPFVVQIYSQGNECVVIAVVTQGVDLTATLISTNGTVWFDDDSGGSLRPLIKARTSGRGWYPLVFSTFAGFSGTSDITFDYGRFPAASAKCANPTSPVAASNKSPRG
ncbi:MAG: hypothetical protein JNM48_10790 [Rhodospirillales bacterium]|nr:hypothetical protein [Rhodospirillales bacterium]